MSVNAVEMQMQPNCKFTQSTSHSKHFTIQPDLEYNKSSIFNQYPMFDWLKNLFHREQTSKKEKVFSFLIALAYLIVMGMKGGSDTKTAFYQSLIKPGAQPPDWAFPIIWIILFVLIAASFYYVWNHYESDLKRKIFAVLYLVNGYFVYLWSHLFFGQQEITGAFYTVIGLIIVIEAMILIALGTNKKGAYLLFPYLAWAIFALYLNTSILILNT